jgi:outer membrane receptor protein involved in Fe transport
VFTWPDTTQNQLWMVNLDGRQLLSRTVTLLGGAYVRHGARDTVNGDAGEFSLCSDDDAASLLCSEDGEPLLDETNSTIPTDVLPNAVFNTTDTSSDGIGASMQLEVREPIASRPNRLLGGVSYDGSHIEFEQRVEVGRLTTDRTVQGEGFYLSGAGNRTTLHVQNHNVGVFVSDTLSLTDPLSLHVSARLNWFDTKLDDRQGDALDGDHSFVRLNPSVGLTYQIIEPLTVFASYGEANRAPTASELACADPDEPCRLPNAFVADPPLEQVVSRSVELGVRARLGDGPRPWLEASLAAFGARNQDDILFIAGSRVGTGYFQNAGDTQRIGLELALAIDRGPVAFYASYTILRATFESELELPGDANPRATPNGEEEGAGEEEEEEEGEEEEGRTLEVAKGSRIPGLPTHSVKAGVTVRPIAGLELGVSMLGQSSQPFRGDEANLLAGVGGYVIMNAHASYRLLEPLTLFVRAQNLLDTRYSTFGVLGEPAEALPGTSNPRFLGRAAPFGLWVGAMVETL